MNDSPPSTTSFSESEVACIRAKTLGGVIWLVRASDPFADESGCMSRSLSMSNEADAAGIWPLAEALVLLEEVKRHWANAELVP